MKKAHQERKQEYRLRYKKKPQANLPTPDLINGVYIQKDLKDCIRELDSLLSQESIDLIKSLDSVEEMSRFHLGFGMSLRNSWGLWAGSRLAVYFKGMGIFHPDDMSGIILDSYYKHVHGQEIDLDEQIRHNQDYWKKQEQELLEKQIEDYAEYQVGDTVFYAYELFATEIQKEQHEQGSCDIYGIITKKIPKRYVIQVKILESCDKVGLPYPKKWNIKYQKKGKKTVVEL